MSLSVLIIGAGISGISAAEFLRREGVSVTLVDRVNPGDPEQTSYGNAGLLASSAIVPISSPGIWKKLPYYLFSKNSPLSINWLYLPKLLPWLIPFLKNTRKEKFLSVIREWAKLKPHEEVTDYHIRTYIYGAMKNAIDKDNNESG